MAAETNNAWQIQEEANSALIAGSVYMGNKVNSEILPLSIDIREIENLDDEQTAVLEALQIESAAVAIRSLASLAEINELDHLGGGLDLIPSLMLTLAVTDYERIDYTIEHAHTSIGYYSALAALGYLDPDIVIDGFRRGLDIAGHVSWVPGGTELNGGRLGVMIPAAVGQALGKRGIQGNDVWVLAHCGDAGWISGQALNGFNAADLHDAPITFVMHRNGIQLSGSNHSIMDKDPRPIVEALGVQIIETANLFEPKSLYTVYRQAFELAARGRPSMIYPCGCRSENGRTVDLHEFGRLLGVSRETEEFAAAHQVAMDTEVWVPGSLMSYRDVGPMLECLFLVNDLSGGEGHHDGHMKGRGLGEVLANPMLQCSQSQHQALDALRSRPPMKRTTEARPAPGSPNLILPADELNAVELPGAGEKVSPRAGVEPGYAAIARVFPDQMFIVSCDLDPSTKLGKARSLLKPDHTFEMSIEEQASALLANGLAVSSRRPQLNVFSTFAAFFEGIAREGFEMWRYQRNLTGVNEGLNVTYHLSHVGSCTGRDHFSGWSLDWITMSLGYLPYLHGFYAPADARSAFIAVRELAAHYGGHIIGVPRDNLPILEKQDGSGPLWQPDSPYEPITNYRSYAGARRAVLAFGAPAYLAAEAATRLSNTGTPTDALIVNGFPLPDDTLPKLFERYTEGIVTIEDGIIGNSATGLRGFASVIASAALRHSVPVAHVGIVDPRIAPSAGHLELWTHFGITTEALVTAVDSL